MLPLTQAHASGLQAALQEAELWKLWYATIPAPEDVKKEIQRRLDLQAQGAMLPFAVMDNKTKKLVGMTTYCNVDAANRCLDIGWAWYQKSVQRTAVNTECKLLLLTHAFEVLDCVAVGFRTNFFNHTSRTAIERLGARFEGTVRNFSIMQNAQPRDVCFYSILPHEWLSVKTNLEFKLSAR